MVGHPWIPSLVLEKKKEEKRKSRSGLEVILELGKRRLGATLEACQKGEGSPGIGRLPLTILGVVTGPRLQGSPLGNGPVLCAAESGKAPQAVRAGCGQGSLSPGRTDSKSSAHLGGGEGEGESVLSTLAYSDFMSDTFHLFLPPTWVTWSSLHHLLPASAPGPTVLSPSSALSPPPAYLTAAP